MPPLRQKYLGATSYDRVLVGRAGDLPVSVRWTGGDSYTVYVGEDSVGTGSFGPGGVIVSSLDGACAFMVLDEYGSQEVWYVDADTDLSGGITPLYLDDIPFANIYWEYPSIGGQQLVLAGDSGEIIVSDDTTVYGLPVDGSTTANWTCSLGSGFLAGSPATERWLRLAPRTVTDEDETMTLALMDDSGTVLDSLTFDHPPDSWLVPEWSPSDTDNTRYSTLQFLPLGSNRVAVIARDVDGSPGYALYHWLRILDCSGGSIDWEGAWTVFDVETANSARDLYPFAANYGGQLAVGLVYRPYG